MAILLAGCQPKPETPEQAQARMVEETAAARTGIEAANAQYVAHFNAGHGDSVAALFTEDGSMMAPNMPAAGRKAMAQEMNMMSGMKPVLALTTVSVAASGPVAVEAGTYKFTFTPPGAKEPMTDQGKYLVHWQKVGDKWRLVHDIWNSDMPAMPAPAPAKKP